VIKFLPHTDELAADINRECAYIQNAINELDVDSLPMEDFYKWYFKKCHLTRQIFSLRTSAKLLYDSLKLLNKPLKDVCMLDYGAGLGTTYLLAKRIGVGKVIYNDLLPEFANPAIEVDKALGITMHDYIIGDTERTCKQVLAKGYKVDLVISRNVLEHIYSLPAFFALMHQYLPQAILYNSTTANYNNPLAHLQHIYLHKKVLSHAANTKVAYLTEHCPQLDKDKATLLAKQSPILNGEDLLVKAKQYLASSILPPKSTEGTNVCDATGNWREHLVPFSLYRQHAKQYNLSFKGGIWDVHQSNIAMRIVGRLMQGITNMLGSYGYIAASFVYIICIPKEIQGRKAKN
jgi:SAM-dependent methyltransferase